MKLNKQLLAVGAIATVGLAGLGGVAAVNAQGNGMGNESIVDSIATKFNLNKDEVTAVFEEQREARQAERHAEMSEKLSAAVENGSITAEQKAAIEAKHEEVEEAREAQVQELKNWAETNGVDLQYVMGRHMNERRLEMAVENGSITAEQKAAIEAKHEEVEAQRTAAHEELKSWAETNGVDLSNIMGNQMGHRGMKGNF